MFGWGWDWLIECQTHLKINHMKKWSATEWFWISKKLDFPPRCFGIQKGSLQHRLEIENIIRSWIFHLHALHCVVEKSKLPSLKKAEMARIQKSPPPNLSAHSLQARISNDIIILQMISYLAPIPCNPGYQTPDRFDLSWYFMQRSPPDLLQFIN